MVQIKRKPVGEDFLTLGWFYTARDGQRYGIWLTRVTVKDADARSDNYLNALKYLQNDAFKSLKKLELLNEFPNELVEYEEV